MSDQTGRFDPSSMPVLDNWLVWDHEDLTRMVNDISTEALRGTGEGWEKWAELVEKVCDQFDTELSRTLGTNLWQGQAADAAADAMTPYQSWGTELADAMRQTGSRVSQAAGAVDTTLMHLPEPKSFDLVRNLRSAYPFGVLGLAYDAYQQFQEQQQAKAEAVRVMNTYFTPAYRDVDGHVPAFPDPPPLPGSTNGPGSAPSSSRPVVPAYSAPTQTAGYAGFGPSGAAPPPAPSGGDHYTPYVYSTTQQTAPAWASTPGLPETVTPQQVAAPAPTEEPGLDRRGSRFGGGGSPGPRESAGPRPGPGAGSGFGPEGQRAAARGAAPARPAAGGSAGTPMGAGGAGRRSEEDREHKNRYVVREDRDEFGIGSYVRPVIGE